MFLQTTVYILYRTCRIQPPPQIHMSSTVLSQKYSENDNLK
jgi:hypothetical protein